eukprot:scaffold312986_cov41-Tisochrysis_lutea.AAC.1
MVMDYTCPSWVVHATEDYEIRVLRPTGARYKFNSTPDNLFHRPLHLKCVRGWCTPATVCIEADKGVFDPWEPGERINQPAYWKADPPQFEHQLRAQGFRTAIVYWVGHVRPILQQCRRNHSCAQTTKVLVDMRAYGVSDDYYRNGSKMVACPPGHSYHVAQNGVMRPCLCAEDERFLNCKQLETTRHPDAELWGPYVPNLTTWA